MHASLDITLESNGLRTVHSNPPAEIMETSKSLEITQDAEAQGRCGA
jgi:hypothetical protein